MFEQTRFIFMPCTVKRIEEVSTDIMHATVSIFVALGCSVCMMY